MRRNAVLLAFLLSLTGAPLRAAEPAAEVPAATRDVVLQAIQEYVEQDIARKGKFLVLDPRTGEPLALAFDHVHQGVKPNGDGFLACVDFKSADGAVHDVDVMVDLAGGEARVTGVLLHKVAGQPVEAKPQ